MTSFLEELKRRKVFRVAGTYAVVAWLIAQIVEALSTPLRLPDWFGTMVVVLLAIGFPVALIFAWALELTPEGLQRDRGPAATTEGGADRESRSEERDTPARGTVSGHEKPGPPPRRTMVIATVGIIVLALGVAAGIAVLAPLSRPVPVTSPAEYRQLTNFSDSVLDPALSPDGRMVTFIRGAGDQFFPFRGGQIYVKQLPDGESVQLTHTPNLKYRPVFSPDGMRVAYTEVSTTDSGVSWDTMTVPVLGGASTRLLPNAAGLTWIDARHVLYSEIKGTGVHMGIVTSTETRAGHREIYFPEHERAMAHYSYISPDRKNVLIVWMDRTSAFRSCRLVPFDGSSPGHPVGPQGVCLAAAWSPDGQWMYFSVQIQEKGLHLWRQRFPDGKPEQITFGPTEEEGVAMVPDGHSLVTAIGQLRSVIILHDASGERALTTEGFATEPHLSPDGRRVYFLLSAGAGAAHRELYAVDIATGSTERVLPDVAINDYDISRDGTEVAYSIETANGEHEIWLAALDHSAAPRRMARSAAKVSFGPSGELFFLDLEKRKNFLMRVRQDGTQRMRVSDTPVLKVWGVSPDGRWEAALSAGTTDHPNSGTIAFPITGGKPHWICPGYCPVRWSPGGDRFYILYMLKSETAANSADVSQIQALEFALTAGASLPPLPAAGLSSADAATFPGAHELTLPYGFFPGKEPSTYVFERPQRQRNLFRIPLH